MKRSVSVFCRLVITVTVCLAAGFFSSVPVSNGETIMGGEIPLMDGADIVKESLFNGSGSFELEVDASPEKVANFYKQAMEKKGWPPGMVMSIGNQSVLMLNKQGDQFVLKAESKNGKTKVTIALIRKAQAQDAATGSLPSTDTAAAPKGISSVPQSETVPQNNGKIIEGAPPTKGSLVQRIVVPPSQGQGEEFGKKDPGSLPEDPSPDPEESSTSSDSNAQTAESADAADETPEILPVSLRVTIRWDVTGTEGGRYEGFVTYQFNGVMKLDAAGSPAIQKADRVLMPVLTYKPEVMTVSYTYDETYIGAEGSDCPVQFEYQGGGVSQIDDDNAAGLKIVRFGSTAEPYLKNLSADKQQFLADMQLSTATPDYYEFYVAGPGQKKTIPGRKRDISSKGCIYQSDEKSLHGLGGMVQMKFPESGAMQGTRTWSADDQGKCPPTLSITVSDITPLLEKSSLRPPEGGNKNVTYTVSWMVGETAELQDTDSEAEDDEDEKWHCKELQNRIDFIKIIRAMYANETIKDYVEQMGGTLKEKMDNYQKAVEKHSIKVGNDESLKTIDQQVNSIEDIDSSDLDYIFSNPEEGSGAKKLLITKPTELFEEWKLIIYGHLNGKEVPIRIYDENGNVTSKETAYYSRVEESWETEYAGKEMGAEVGRAKFEAALEHEAVHVRQFAQNKRNPKSLDELADWELEAYKIEMESLRKKMDEWGC